MLETGTALKAADQRGVKSRAAVLHSHNAPFEIASVVLQPPQGEDMLVRIVGAGICHTDVVCRAAFPVPMPIVLGHEGSGVVEAVGRDVQHIKPGDHVVLSFASCGRCPSCENDSPAYCREFMPRNFGAGPDAYPHMHSNSVPINASFFGQSSFAEHAIVPERNAVLVPSSLPLAVLGPLGCAVQTGAGAILNSLGVKKGDRVTIFGGGAVGLSAVMAAKIAGAQGIVLFEPIPERRALALELGATHVFDPAARTSAAKTVQEAVGGATHALDTTGIPQVIAGAADTLLAKGVLGLLGLSAPDATLPLNILSLMTRGITVKTIIEGDSDPKSFIPELVQYYIDGKLPIERLVTEYSFEDINAAFADVAAGNVIKPVLLMR